MKDTRNLLLIIIIVLTVFAGGSAMAAQETVDLSDIIRGAQLYDKWYAVVGTEAPPGNMPIWSRQSTNTRSGENTWRCSECHGWDYRGAQGAYQSGSHFTGFPDLFMLVPELEHQEIVDHLNGKIDPAHNFSTYLDEVSITQLATFLKNGLIDDSVYINPVSLRLIDPDVEHGKQLFTNTCVECHGEDGKTITLQIEGIADSLGSVANRDPWRFLHRTRFGVAGTDMPVGMSLGWQPEDGRDVLAYAQTLPTGGIITNQYSQGSQVTPAPQVGGPAVNLWTGILTSLGTLAGVLVMAGFFIGGFALLAFIVVVIMRRRGKRS